MASELRVAPPVVCSRVTQAVVVHQPPQTWPGHTENFASVTTMPVCRFQYFGDVCLFNILKAFGVVLHDVYGVTAVSRTTSEERCLAVNPG